MALTFDDGDHEGRGNGQGIGLLLNRTRVLVPAPFSHYKQTRRPEGGQQRGDRQEIVHPNQSAETPSRLCHNRSEAVLQTTVGEANFSVPPAVSAFPGR